MSYEPKTVWVGGPPYPPDTAPPEVLSKRTIEKGMWAEERQKILAMIRANPGITRAQLAIRVNMKEAAVHQRLATLKDNKLVTSSGALVEKKNRKGVIKPTYRLVYHAVQ
jgi:predicted HTH transcriptional regulator